jgi:hypothetical protein
VYAGKLIEGHCDSEQTRILHYTLQINKARGVAGNTHRAHSKPSSVMQTITKTPILRWLVTKLIVKHSHAGHERFTSDDTCPGHVCTANKHRSRLNAQALAIFKVTGQQHHEASVHKESTAGLTNKRRGSIRNGASNWPKNLESKANQRVGISKANVNNAI